MGEVERYDVFVCQLNGSGLYKKSFYDYANFKVFCRKINLSTHFLILEIETYTRDADGNIHKEGRLQYA